MFLVGASDKNLAVIAAILEASSRRHKPEARSGDRVVRPGTPAPTRQPSGRTPAGILIAAYDRFLELPVPVVLAALWVVGVALLVAAAMVAHSVVTAIL